MSLFFGNRLERMLRDKAGDDEGGGGDKGKPDLSKEIEALKTQNADLTKKFEALMKSKSKSKDESDDNSDDEGDEQDDLRTKAKKNREAEDKKNSDTKSLEAALKFSMGSKDWLKTHSNLLPKNIEDIFKTAEKETFDSAIEKDNSIKSGIIQSFFEVQSNVDLLTSAQKSALEDYLKLTKNGKQDKAQNIYDMIFEPAFEMLKRVKKAEALNAGFGAGSDNGYKKRLMDMTRKHYLGEKS